MNLQKQDNRKQFPSFPLSTRINTPCLLIGGTIFVWFMRSSFLVPGNHLSYVVNRKATHFRDAGVGCFSCGSLESDDYTVFS